MTLTTHAANCRKSKYTSVLILFPFKQKSNPMIEWKQERPSTHFLLYATQASQRKVLIWHYANLDTLLCRV